MTLLIFEPMINSREYVCMQINNTIKVSIQSKVEDP